MMRSWIRFRADGRTPLYPPIRMGGARRGERPVVVLTVIMAVGLIARIIVSILYGDNDVPYYEYMTIAQNLLDGKGYSFDEWGRAPLQPTSFLPPLYVYWCALFMSFLGGQYLWMYIAQAVVAVSGCIPAYLIGRRLFSHGAGIGCAVAYAFYPEFMFTHSRATAEFLYLVLALWMILFYFQIKERIEHETPATWPVILLGVVSGLAILVKEGAGVLVTAIGIGLLWKREYRRLALKSTVLPLTAIVLLIMSPWIVRNYLVQGEFIPIRTGYGVTFWLANHPGGTGTAYTMDGVSILAKMDSTLLAQVAAKLPADEQDRDHVYREEGKSYVRDHFREYLHFCARRLGYFLWFDQTHPIARRIEYRFGFVGLLVMALPGIVWAMRRRKLDPVFGLATLGYLILYVPVMVLPRYRVVPVLFLVLFAGLALALLWEKTVRHIVDNNNFRPTPETASD